MKPIDFINPTVRRVLTFKLSLKVLAEIILNSIKNCKIFWDKKHVSNKISYARSVLRCHFAIILKLIYIILLMKIKVLYHIKILTILLLAQ
jgi:hypothetical protein